jgi:hypothetical protein
VWSKENSFGRRSFLKKGGMAAGLGLFADLEAYPQNVNRNSKPSDLKITDMRIAVLSQNRGGGGGGRGGGRGSQVTTPRGQAYPGAAPWAAPGRGGVGMGQILVRIDTNQGISGYGEMYNGGVPPYALMLKSRSSARIPATSRRFPQDQAIRRASAAGGRRDGGGAGVLGYRRSSLWRAGSSNARREVP